MEDVENTEKVFASARVKAEFRRTVKEALAADGLSLQQLIVDAMSAYLAGKRILPPPDDSTHDDAAWGRAFKKWLDAPCSDELREIKDFARRHVKAQM